MAGPGRLSCESWLCEGGVDSGRSGSVEETPAPRRQFLQGRQQEGEKTYGDYNAGEEGKTRA